MATSRHLFLHLAAWVAGWGIVTALKPSLPAAAESFAATKASTASPRTSPPRPRRG